MTARNKYLTGLITADYWRYPPFPYETRHWSLDLVDTTVSARILDGSGDEPIAVGSWLRLGTIAVDMCSSATKTPIPLLCYRTSGDSLIDDRFGKGYQAGLRQQGRPRGTCRRADMPHSRGAGRCLTSDSRNHGNAGGVLPPCQALNSDRNVTCLTVFSKKCDQKARTHKRTRSDPQRITSGPREPSESVVEFVAGKIPAI